MTKREAAELMKNGEDLNCGKCPFNENGCYCDAHPCTASFYGCTAFSKQWLEDHKENQEMTKTERIEEMEVSIADTQRQLSALKAEVKKEERVEYPCVMDYEGVAVLITHKSENSDDPNGYVLNKGKYMFHFGHNKGFWNNKTPFTGIITYRNGKPV